MALTVRQFAASDAEAWLKVHHAAIHGLAASDYPQAVLRRELPKAASNAAMLDRVLRVLDEAA